MQRPTDSVPSGPADLQDIPFQARELSLELNRALIEQVLQRSPTGGNAKPFHWSWHSQEQVQDQDLVIHHSEKLAKHYLNRNNATSWIALGCLLKSLEVAARFQGFRLQYEISSDNPSMRVRFLAGSSLAADTGDLKALNQRSTYRGPLSFSDKPVMRGPSTGSPVQIRLAAALDISRETKKYLTEADSYLWLQTQASRDFFKEVNFSKKPQTAQDRGISVKDLGIGLMDQMMLRLFSWMPRLPGVLVRWPLLNSSFRAATQRSLKNAHLILISAKDLDPKSLVQVGQEAMQVWIEMEKQGYKVQPLSLASIPLLDAANGHLPEDTKLQFRELFLQVGPRILREQFQLKPVDRPVWLLRVGRAEK